MTRIPSRDEQRAYEKAQARMNAAIEKAWVKWSEKQAKAQKMIDEAGSELEAAKVQARDKFRDEEAAIYERFNPRR